MDGIYLGIEGGGTRSVALLADAAGRVVARAEAGVGNLRLVSDGELAARMSELAEKCGVRPGGLRGVGVGLAGCRDAGDRTRVVEVLEQLWPGVPRRVDHDLETAWQAAFADAPEPGRGRNKASKPGKYPASGEGAVAIQGLVIRGTGSCCYGKNLMGDVMRIGGWGHQLGDWGSGYDVALTALREVVGHLELTGDWPWLGARFLRRLMLNEPSGLIEWMQGARKDEVAGLATEVFSAAAAGDLMASRVLRRCQGALVAQAVALIRRLGPQGGRSGRSGRSGRRGLSHGAGATVEGDPLSSNRE